MNKTIYKLIYYYQCILHYIGIAWHNSYSNECTSDFNCCNNIGKKSFIKFPQK